MCHCMLYVNDILIFGSNIHFINDVKSFWSSNFDMKDLDHVDVIFYIKLIKKNDDMILTQSHYVEKLLNLKFLTSKLFDLNSNGFVASHILCAKCKSTL